MTTPSSRTTPSASTRRVPRRTEMLSVASIWSMRYWDMPDVSELPRISRLTWDAYLARCRAACPAEFAPPTTATGRPVRAGASTPAAP